MQSSTQQALRNAAASSAMEGLPLQPKDYDIIQEILDGKTSLQAYLKQLQEQYLES